MDRTKFCSELISIVHCSFQYYFVLYIVVAHCWCLISLIVFVYNIDGLGNPDVLLYHVNRWCCIVKYTINMMNTYVHTGVVHYHYYDEDCWCFLLK